MRFFEIATKPRFLQSWYHQDEAAKVPIILFAERVFRNRGKKLSNVQLADKIHALAAYLGVNTAMGKAGDREQTDRLDAMGNAKEPMPYSLIRKSERHWDTKTLFAPTKRNVGQKTIASRETSENLLHELCHYQTSGTFRKDIDWGLGAVDGRVRSDARNAA